MGALWGGPDRWGQGGPERPPKRRPATGHGGPIGEVVAESGGQWVPRGDPRYRPGPGTGRGHGTPRGGVWGRGPIVEFLL